MRAQPASRCQSFRGLVGGAAAAASVWLFPLPARMIGIRVKAPCQEELPLVARLRIFQSLLDQLGELAIVLVSLRIGLSKGASDRGIVLFDFPRIRDYARKTFGAVTAILKIASAQRV